MRDLSKLIRIQTNLKVPKNLYNDYGGYNYRNAEGILEAVKSYLAEEQCALTLTDSIITRGDSNYVEATATLWDMGGEEIMSVSACAREAKVQKGMNDSQITGSTSSYARKYALNGLFDLDDTKDADVSEYTRQCREGSGQESKGPVAFKPQSRPEKPVMTKTNRERAIEAYKKTGKAITELAKEYGVTKNTTDEEWKQIADAIEREVQV